MTERGEDRIELRRGDPEAEARMRALSSPLRLRVLRLCAFESRTNKELAELLDINPGTMLHHVRTLVQTGYLAAEPERAGAQGAREIPYRATGLSWRTSMPERIPRARRDVPAADRGTSTTTSLDTTWLGLKLNDEHKAELESGSTISSTSSKSAGRMPTARPTRCSPPSTPTTTRRGHRSTPHDGTSGGDRRLFTACPGAPASTHPSRGGMAIAQEVWTALRRRRIVVSRHSLGG